MITVVGIGLIAGLAYIIYTSGVAQGLTFSVPMLDGFSFDKNLAQGYAIVVVGLAIGVQLFKAAVKTDHTQMA